MWNNCKRYHNIWINIFPGKAKLDHHPFVRKFPSITATVKSGITFETEQKKNVKYITQQIYTH
jgi:hypothetical protein